MLMVRVLHVCMHSFAATRSEDGYPLVERNPDPGPLLQIRLLRVGEKSFRRIAAKKDSGGTCRDVSLVREEGVV
jgi:hypothetical protein